jgi:hypothetical protein
MQSLGLDDGDAKTQRADIFPKKTGAHIRFPAGENRQSAKSLPVIASFFVRDVSAARRIEIAFCGRARPDIATLSMAKSTGDMHPGVPWRGCRRRSVPQATLQNRKTNSASGSPEWGHRREGG